MKITHQNMTKLRLLMVVEEQCLEKKKTALNYYPLVRRYLGMIIYYRKAFRVRKKDILLGTVRLSIADYQVIGKPVFQME